MTLRLFLPLDVSLRSKWALRLMLQLSFQLVLLQSHLLFLLPLFMVFIQRAESCQGITTGELTALGDGAIEGVTGASCLLE